MSFLQRWCVFGGSSFRFPESSPYEVVAMSLETEERTPYEIIEQEKEDGEYINCGHKS
jgi:hypothetical protein